MRIWLMILTLVMSFQFVVIIGIGATVGEQTDVINQHADAINHNLDISNGNFADIAEAIDAHSDSINQIIWRLDNAR